MKNPYISIIIPGYNVQTTIRQTIEAVLALDAVVPFEVIFVDDGSVDETKEIVQFFSKVRYFYQENSGPASARNAGAKIALGEILFFTDSDCIAPKNWIKEMLAHFNRDEIAVVCGSYGIANSANVLARCIHQEIIFRHDRLMPEYPKVFGSYNCAIRKSDFDKAGGFSAIYRQASGEDNDLSYKIIASGKKIFFERKALVDHFHTQEVLRYLKEQYRHGFWRARMYVDHPGMMRGDDYTFFKDALEIPWAFLNIFLIVLCVLSVNWHIGLILCLGLLFIFEVFFAFFITRSFFRGLFWSGVMVLRAHARALGFLFGLFRFLPAVFSSGKR